MGNYYHILGKELFIIITILFIGIFIFIIRFLFFMMMIMVAKLGLPFLLDLFLFYCCYCYFLMLMLKLYVFIIFVSLSFGLTDTSIYGSAILGYRSGSDIVGKLPAIILFRTYYLQASFCDWVYIVCDSKNEILYFCNTSIKIQCNI